MSMNDIVLIAIRAEAPDLSHMMNLFYTGVGKVNAAMTASEVITKLSPVLQVRPVVLPMCVPVSNGVCPGVHPNASQVMSLCTN